jgi:predicted nucleotidyltransferase
MPDPNLLLLEEAAARLASFLPEIVFVGGVTLGLLITDQAAAPVRNTNDVDVIAEILSYVDYIAFAERLRNAGFSEDTGEGALTCRWFHGKLKLDVLPLSKEVLGYTNVWYASALHRATSFLLPGGQSIRLITAPYFLGTKMEAFRGRGQMDFQASHDLEDFVAVIDGRSTILEEVANSPGDLREYLADAASSLLSESAFLDVLPGLVLDEGRVPLVRERLDQLALLTPVVL